MYREQVITTLRAHTPELKVCRELCGYGYSAPSHAASTAPSLTLTFWSTSTKQRVSCHCWISYASRKASDVLGGHVDLVQGKSLKARVRRNVEREAVLAFLGMQRKNRGDSSPISRFTLELISECHGGHEGERRSHINVHSNLRPEKKRTPYIDRRAASQNESQARIRFH